MPIAIQNGPFAPNETFLGKIINMNFTCLLACFNVQNFEIDLKLSLSGALSMHYNFGSKMAHLPQPGIFLVKLFI